MSTAAFLPVLGLREMVEDFRPLKRFGFEKCHFQVPRNNDYRWLCLGLGQPPLHPFVV